jgi:flagellar motility protein MotE (MotC chaperone)
MSRMIKFFSIAVVLFSVAAAASWYLQGQQSPPENEETPAKHTAERPHGKAAGHDAPAPRLLARTSSSPDADRFTQLAATLQAQQEALKNREQHVVVREKQLDLIHEDIKKDQKKLDAVRKEVEEELQLVQEKLDLLEKRTGEGAKDREKTEAQLNELRQATLEVTDLESKNLKQVAGIYDKMDPEAAAQNIQQMTEKGGLDTAVTILANMRERQAANLLGELSKLDAGIAAQVFERMRYLKTPAKKAATD